jgi:hypothetical protein
MKVMALDSLSAIIGLVLLVWPFVERTFPGDIDTTAHVALGALIATAAVFRVLVAYGSLWLEVVLGALGIITWCMPRVQHMAWNPRYATVHVVAGGLIVALALISGAITVPVLKMRSRA